MKEQMRQQMDQVKAKFRHSTLSFLFIIGYVSIFPMVFGMENNIVAVIFTIMMSASMVRDLTATPLRHFLIQSCILVWMAFAACYIHVLGIIPAFLLNGMTLFLILYAYTYEYATHIYFPYILSYLFLIFISPVPPTLLPKRLLAMLCGALSMMLYQWVMGRKRIQQTAQEVLCEMIDELHILLDKRMCTSLNDCDLKQMHQKLHTLSQTVYDRRKKALCVSKASFSLIDVGRGLEHLLVLVHELPEPLDAQDRLLLLEIDTHLMSYRAYLEKQLTQLPDIPPFLTRSEKESRLFHQTLAYIRDRLLHMSDPENRNRYHKTMLSLKTRLSFALDYSPVRFIYALRVSLLLASATAVVLSFSLPHGKWLLFTLASVSLPYQDDVLPKMKQRIFATVLGGIASVFLYSLIASPNGRTAAMMLSGYLSFYFSDYLATFACSTIGAMGGAVFLSSFGWSANLEMFAIRLAYILAGALMAYLVNCKLFPYTRAMATRALWKKYQAVTKLLLTICEQSQVDSQLYYNLMIQAHRIEDKLSKNAVLENWHDFPASLRHCRKQVYYAHRKQLKERQDAIIFEPAHLK